MLCACQGETTGPDSDRGTLRILVETTGATLDSDGYSYRIGSTDLALAARDSQDARGLVVGTYPAELGGLASNCRVFSPGPDSVAIVSGQITRVSLVVSCDSALRNVVLFEHWTEAGRPEVWMMRPDGGGKKRFLTEASDPAATPNGTEVIYLDWTTLRLSRIRADSTKRRPAVTGVPGGQYRPDVSPDGRSVVFESTTGGPTQIYRADLDGSGIRQLTAGGPDFEPRWSPDGRFVTFTRLTTDIQLYRIPAEGGEAVPLTALGEGGLARWSPQGDRLLFFNPVGGGLWSMAPDGSSASPIAGAPFNASYAEWSPHATEILIETVLDGSAQIQRVPLDGTGIDTITDQGQNMLGRWLR